MEALIISFLSFVGCYLAFGFLVTIGIFGYNAILLIRSGDFVSFLRRSDELKERYKNIGVKPNGSIGALLGWPFLISFYIRAIYNKRTFFEQMFLEVEQKLEKKEKAYRLAHAPEFKAHEEVEKMVDNLKWPKE